MRPEIQSSKVHLNDTEGAILKMVQEQKQIELSTLRAAFDISNKLWDTSLKTLTKNQLVSVFKEQDTLIVKIVG